MSFSSIPMYKAKSGPSTVKKHLPTLSSAVKVDLMDQHASNQSEWGKNPAKTAENIFLEGPKSGTFDLRNAFTAFCEMLHGFRRLHSVGPCITIFGSARFTEEHPYYALTRKIAAEFAMLGFTIMTGGGPGLMEAANRGAKDVKGRSIGCNIKLPKEQHPNQYLDQFLEFTYFFVRKVMLIKYSYAFVAMPGGFGTMDEMFQVTTLVQTKRLRGFPVVLVGKAYWGGLHEFIVDKFVNNKTINAEDLKYFVLVDTVEEAVKVVEELALGPFGLKKIVR
jgi:uncharacterized protein (TIGR00730 family)